MFLVTLRQVVSLLIYVFVGYLLGKKKIVSSGISVGMSKLLVYVFSPAYLIISLSGDVSADNLLNYAMLMCAGAGVLVAVFALACAFARMFSAGGFDYNIYKYIFMFTNIGYFGYPLVRMVFGEEMLVKYIFFNMAFNFMINTYGYFIATKSENAGEEQAERVKRIDIRGVLFSPLTISMVIGITLGLLPVTIPQFFYDLMQPAADCMSATAMIVIGLVLSRYPFKDLLLFKKAYFVAAVRLIAIPLVIGSVTYLLYRLINFDSTVFILIVCSLCLPAGMNVVVFPESAGLDGSLGAKASFLSYVVCSVTIPLIFWTVSLLA